MTGRHRIRGSVWLLLGLTLSISLACGRVLRLDELDFSAGAKSSGHGGQAAGGSGAAAGGSDQAGGEAQAGDAGAGVVADCVAPAELSCAPQQVCTRAACGGHLWPAGTVRYRFQDVPAELQKRVKARAVAWGSDVTPEPAVQFARCSKDDCDAYSRFLTVRVGVEVSLSASVPQGEQVLTLPDDVSDERIAHELGHVLGLPDVWRRPDRDRFVTLSERAFCAENDAEADISKCDAGEYDGRSQPTRRPSGYFGPFDASSAMNLGGPRVCEAEDPDPARTVPTESDTASAIELYRTASAWSPFLPLAREVSPTKPLDLALGKGVSINGSPALALPAYPAPLVFARGSDHSLYWKWQAYNDGQYDDWSDWTSLGCCFESDPSAASWTNNRVDLFVLNQDGEVGWRTWSGSPAAWSVWRTLGAPAILAASAPAATSSGPGRLEVFVRGRDDLLYWKRYNGTWGPWQELGNGPIAGRPAVASVRGERIDVVTLDPDGVLQHLSIQVPTWQPLAGAVAPDTSPALAASAGELYLYFTSAENSHLYERVTSNLKWGEVRDLGGVVQGSPAAIGSPDRPHVDVAAVVEEGGNSGVWLRSWPYQRPCFASGQACGSCDEACDGPCTKLAAPVSSPEFFIDAQGQDVWTFRAADDHVYRLTKSGDGVMDLTLLSSAAGFALDGPRGFVRGDSADSFVYRGLDEQVWAITGASTAWDYLNLGAAAEAPHASGRPVPWVRGDGVSSVLFMGKDFHLHELTLDGSWQHQDLFMEGQLDVYGDEPRPFVRSDGQSSIIFRTFYDQLEELYLENGSWHRAEVTVPLGAPRSYHNPSPYVRNDASNTIVYVAEGQNHVYELSAPSDSRSYTVTDLSAQIGAPGAFREARAHQRGDDLNAIVYPAVGGGVYEIFSSLGKWYFHNISAEAQAPSAADVVVPYVRSDGTTAVAYLTPDQRLVELELDVGSNTYSSHELYRAP